MDIKITGRHFEVPEPLERHTTRQVSRLGKFFDRIVYCHVTMSVEKHRHRAELTLNLYGHTLRASSESNDMRVSVDDAVEKLERQLKRVHAKMREPHRVNKEELIALAIKEIEAEAAQEEAQRD